MCSRLACGKWSIGRNSEVEMMSGVSLLWRHAVLCLLSFISLFSKVHRSGASHLLSPLFFCCLSSHCWADNHLPYLWTWSLACHIFGVLCYNIAMAPWRAHARKVRKLCVNPYISIVDLSQRDIQAQLQSKTPLTPAVPTRLWASSNQKLTECSGCVCFKWESSGLYYLNSRTWR